MPMSMLGRTISASAEGATWPNANFAITAPATNRIASTAAVDVNDRADRLVGRVSGNMAPTNTAATTAREPHMGGVPHVVQSNTPAHHGIAMPPQGLPQSSLYT